MPDPLKGESNHITKEPKTSSKHATPTQERPVIQKIREQCLKRGSKGIRGLGRLFKRADDDGDKSVNAEELAKLIKEYGIDGVKEAEVAEVIADVDDDGSGTINFEEFLSMLRPPMSAARKRIIDTAFQKLDKTGDGVITVEDLKGVYKVNNHAKYLNGEWTKEQCLGEFLKTFDVTNQDGTVTKEEFQAYYEKVSMSIDEDAYFTLMMTNCWKLE